MFLSFNPIKYILIIWGGDALKEGHLSEVILGKRKLKGKHVSIYLRSGSSYSDRNIASDEKAGQSVLLIWWNISAVGNSICSNSVLTKQLQSNLVSWMGLFMEKPCLVLVVLPGSWKCLDCHKLPLLIVSVQNFWMNLWNPDSISSRKTAALA